MKKTFLIIIISWFTISKGFCQTKMDDIKELISIVYKEKTSEESYDAVVKMMKAQMDSYKKFNTNNNAYIDSIMQDAFTFAKKLNKDNMPLIYDRLFTHDEIKEYIRFYKSAAGQKLIDSQGAIQKELMDSISKYILGIQAKFKAKLEERYADTTTYTNDSIKGKESKKDSTFSQRYRTLSDKLDSITRKELKNGVYTDTAFMTFCFGDSPEKTNAKLTSLIKSGNAVVDSSRKIKLFTFPNDGMLKKGTWKISFQYAHEVLAEVHIYFFRSVNDWFDESISVLNMRDALQKKYGACNAVDSTSGSEYTDYNFYWIKNNLKVHIYGNESAKNKRANTLRISYSDTRYDKITIDE
jgi:hypothetical protein